MDPQILSVKNQIGNILGFVSQGPSQGYDVGTYRHIFAQCLLVTLKIQ